MFGGSSHSDSRCRVIEDVLDKLDVEVVLNTGSPTRLFTGGKGHIDLALASPSLCAGFDWEVLDESGSDHNVIVIKFKVSVNYEDLTAVKWIFSKAIGRSLWS